MYLGIDIGGTKTLVAVLNEQAEIVESFKFPTPQDYNEFQGALQEALTHLEHHDFAAAAVAIPGRLDRENGVAHNLGNLPWKEVPVQADCEAILRCPVIIENDAKLAGLSEAMLHKDYRDVLYVTVSTGIGTALIRDQRLDPALQHSEGGHMMLPFEGNLVMWEKFASGRAIYEHFGRKAADIPKEETDVWSYVARNIAAGLFELIAVLEPDLIVIGGSIGTYFDKYGELLVAELKKNETPIVPIPPVVGAGRAEQAVVYGCYDIIKQELPHAGTA